MVRLREGVTHVLVGEGETLTVRGLQEDLQRKEVYILYYMMHAGITQKVYTYM